MAKRKLSRQQTVAPLVRPRTRLGPVDTSALVNQMREVYEKAGSADGMPDDAELYGALVWAGRHSDRLRTAAPEARREAALIRVRLWEVLKERCDPHQAAAVDAAREAGAEWADLAGALAVRTPSAAYNKAQRLRGASLMVDGQPVRRTPEAVTAAQHELARRQAAEQRREQAATRRHRLVAAVATRLLAHRTDFDAGDERDDVDYWLDEASAVLADCTTPRQQASLETYLRAALRHLDRHTRITARPAARTNEAHAAYAAAASLLSASDAR
ncbi:hypothetical protein [Streptomyces sp. NPDC018031]|uniref:hypothetical protein n=1 Tax=Streptomyces sp. NPDC018031 TaxID=3365033 RepID=UPI0037A24EC7